MLYLLLAIVSSAAFSLCTRLSSHKVKSQLGMLAVNYISCLILAGCYTGFSAPFPRHEALQLVAEGFLTDAVDRFHSTADND